MGMSIEQVKQAASEKGYTFSNAIKSSSSPNWISYILMKDGPSVSFCNDVFSGVNKEYKSNLHEFTSLLGKSIASLGIPKTTTSQDYYQGAQRSSVDFNWLGKDNIRRS